MQIITAPASISAKCTASVSIIRFGLAEDLPIPSDFDGDGRKDIWTSLPDVVEACVRTDHTAAAATYLSQLVMLLAPGRRAAVSRQLRKPLKRPASMRFANISPLPSALQWRLSVTL